MTMNVMDNAKNKRLLATERGEPERSGGEPNGVAHNRAAAAAPLPDPEVSATSQRRRFTPAYKARIVEEAMACTEPGQIGALLRREGLYSPALTLWRQHYQSGALQALKDDKRTRDARDQELKRLRREIERLNKKLNQAERIIDIQKKLRRCSAIPSRPHGTTRTSHEHD